MSLPYLTGLTRSREVALPEEEYGASGGAIAFLGLEKPDLRTMEFLRWLSARPPFS